MKKILYAAYGSNMNAQQMAYRCPNSKIFGKTFIEDYILLFRGINGKAVANIEPSPGDKVPVIIWEISKSDELNLNRFEGYPTVYKKEYLKIKVKGRYRKIMLYIMEQDRLLGMPSKQYFKKVLDGYRLFGFNEEYLKTAALVSCQEY